jgi:ABC-type glutathione transport system ATPase component
MVNAGWPASVSPREAAIFVEDLTYSYSRSKTTAISGLDFHVEPGEIFGFLGPNGAGKSLGLARRQSSARVGGLSRGQARTIDRSTTSSFSSRPSSKATALWSST